jgi:hypothetical protein
MERLERKLDIISKEEEETQRRWAWRAVTHATHGQMPWICQVPPHKFPYGSYGHKTINLWDRKVYHQKISSAESHTDDQKEEGEIQEMRVEKGFKDLRIQERDI